MIVTKCLFCGSSNMSADRALSGRLVCNSCGTPYGVRRAGSRKNQNIFSFKSKYFLFFCILIFAFFLVII